MNGMIEARHAPQPDRHLLLQPRLGAYPEPVADGSDIRRVRIDAELWAAYEQIVGNGGRSADIKAYIEWRVDNPTTPLPGKRRGPVKRVRRSSRDEA